MPQTVTYQLRIRNASTLAAPDGPDPDFLVITSDPVGTNPYIAAPPSGDGAEVDPLTGAVRTGAYVVEVVDADTGTDATGTLRVVTNKLEDATFRQQLLSRRAYVDVIRAGVSSRLVAGYISSVRLISPMRYAITVGDTRRVERTQTIFQGAALGGYTTRGCITGGPITPVDFGTVKARGGWRYLVSKSGDDVTLTFVDGYEPGAGSPIVKDWRQVNRSEIADVIEGYRQPNPYAIGGGSSFVTSYTTPVFDFTSGSWVVAGGVQAVVGSTATNGAAVRALVCGYSEVPANEALGVSNVYLYWPSCPYSNGQTVFVSLTTVDVNETCPLYLDAHPVDLVTAIWTNARVKYSASAAATVKTLIGDTVRLACRFPQAPLMDEFLQQAIYGPFGISERTNSNGEQELFPTRIKTDVLPTLTVNAAAMRGADEVVFDLDEQTAVSGIRLTQQVLSPKGYAPGTQTQNGTNTGTQTSGPLDGIVVSEVTQTAQYLDPNLAVFAGRVVEYKIPGMIHTAADFVPATSDQLDAIAIGTFDRFGRGCQAAEVSVLATAGAAAAQIGDEVYFEAPHFPNKGYRIGESTVGARIMQVVRRTETPAGPVFRLLDSGLAAQPVSPAATITIAQNPNAPSNTARFTITNAATINATNILQVRVEWAVGTTTPTGNGADFAFYPAGAVPTGAVDLPPVTTPGQTVYVRARTEQAGRRPSAWTAWASVALANIPTVSSLTSSNLRQTAVTLTWTNGSSTLPLAVYAFQGGSAPANWAPYRVGTLPAGTTSTVVRNLTGPTVQWTLGVAYETAQAVGAVTSTTVTTNSTLDTPTRPAGLAIIPGVDDATLTQGIALALWGSDQTLDLQIQRSTVSGSGFATIATVSGATTVYVDQLPRNGVTYYYRIAHVLGGFTTSSYTPEVSGTARGVPVNVTRPGAVTPVVQVQTSETATTGTVTLTITDPQNRVVQVRFRERTNGGAWGAWVVDSTVPYSYTGTLPATGFLDIEYEVTGFDAAGTAAQVLAGGIESFDTNTTPDMVSVVGTFNSAGAFTLAISADSDTASVKYAISTVSQPTLATVQAQAAINGRNLTATFAGPYASGTTVFVSVLGYTGTSGTGSESALFEYRFVRDGGLVYSECFAAITAATATQILVTVTATAATGTPTVQLVAVNGSATVVSGYPAPGIPQPSGTQWLFNRGPALGGSGQAQFRAVLSGTQSDDDFIEIPEQGRDTTYLTTRARVRNTTATQVFVRVAVLDKYSNLTASITQLPYGVPGITPNTTQTVTTVQGDTFPAEVVGYYVDYTIDRPAFGAGTGRVVFTATNAQRVADSDSVDIPAIERDTIALTSRARIFSQTATQMVIRYAVATPVALSPNTANITYVTEGLGTVSPGSPGVPQAITPETNTQITEPLLSYIDFTVPRPAVGANPGRITFQATATNRTASSDAVDVPPQERVGPSLKVVTTPGTSSYSLEITWDGTIAYALDGVTQSVSGWTSPRTETITRGDIGSNTKVAAFAVTKDSVTVSESINIPPKDITSASLSIGTQTADDTTNTYEFDWTASNFPTGTTYDLNYRTVTTTGDVEEGYYSGLTTTDQDVLSGYTIGLNPTYQMTVSAVLSGAVLMSRSRTGTFLT
jgi:hypothetical protein